MGSYTGVLVKFSFLFVVSVYLAQGYTPEERSTRIVKGKYLVQLQDGRTAADLPNLNIVKDIREYTVGKIRIAAFEVDDENDVNVLKNHPSVKHLEPNGLASLIEPVEIRKPNNYGKSHDKKTDNPSVQRPGCNQQPLVTDHDDYGTWGLIRTSYWHPPDFHTQPYLYDNAGEGVRAYVFDTGIELDHVEFEGRAEHGMYAREFADEGKTDYSGHGTHVASTVGGAIYGMAKKCTLVDIKVLGGAAGWGLLESNIEGLEWVANDISMRRDRGDRVKAVINMSLGYAWHSWIFFNAVQETVDLGCANVVAAGNAGSDSRIFTPAAFTNTISVAAIERENDRMIWWSSFGEYVDISAPGVAITGAWSNSSIWCKNETAFQCLLTVSGTSMASPHTAGAVARYLSSIPNEEYDAMDPGEIAEHVREKLIAYSGKGFLKFQNENQALTPNRYLMVPCGEIPPDQTTTTTQAPPTTPPEDDENGASGLSAGMYLLIVLIASFQ